MSKAKKPKIGAITWTDLTVKDAAKVRDFYREVVGWKVSEVKMGGYNDYSMNLPSGGQTVAGVCHARGSNVNLPPQWLIYVTVANVEASAERAAKLGGKVLAGPRDLGQGRMCVIRDPAGAVMALFQPTVKPLKP